MPEPANPGDLLTVDALLKEHRALEPPAAIALAHSTVEGKS